MTDGELKKPLSVRFGVPLHARDCVALGIGPLRIVALDGMIDLEDAREVETLLGVVRRKVQHDKRN